MSKVDQLLEEYLRVINDKDDEIHKLIKEKEDTRSACKKKENSLKYKIVSLEAALRDKNDLINDLQTRIEGDAVVINQLTDTKAKLVTQNEICTQELEDANKRCHALNSQIESAASERERLQKELADMQTNQKRDADRFQRQVEEQSRQAQSLQSENASLSEKLKAAEEACTVAQKALEEMRVEMKRSIPMEEHDKKTTTLHAELCAARNQLQEETNRHLTMIETLKCEKREVDQRNARLDQRLKEATEEVNTSTKALERLQCQMSSVSTEHAREAQSQAKELSLLKESKEAVAHQLSRTQSEAEGLNDKLQRTQTILHEYEVEMERVRTSSKMAEEHLRNQLNTVNEQCRRLQEEMEKQKLRADSKEAAWKETSNSLALTKEENAVVISDLRQKTASLSSELAHKKEECDRLSYEAKNFQQQYDNAKTKLSQEQNVFQRKIDELTTERDSLRDKLRCREGELKENAVHHDKIIHEMQHKFDGSMEELRRSKSSEIQEFQVRLDRLKSELADHNGGNKGLLKELEVSTEVLRQLREEIGKLQNALTLKEDQMGNLKRELDDLRSKNAAHEQRHIARDEALENSRMNMSEIRREMESLREEVSKANHRREEAEKKNSLQMEEMAKLLKTVGELESAEKSQKNVINELKTALELAAKKAAEDSNEKVKLLHTIDSREEEVRKQTSVALEVERDVKQARHELQQAKDDIERLKRSVAEREGERSRLAKHAEEVENLAKKTMEELQGSIRNRDTLIESLQRDQAAVVPELEESRSRALILQEKLQHQLELYRMKEATMQSKIRDLEAEVDVKKRMAEQAGSERDTAKDATLEARQHISELSSQLRSVNKKLEAKKDELERTLAELERERQQRVDDTRTVSEELAAADSMREKYKKEKSKIETLVKQLEEKIHLSERSEKLSRQREETLLAEVQEHAKIVSDVEENHRRRMEDLKETYQKLLQEQESALKQASDKMMNSEALLLEMKKKELRSEEIRKQYEHEMLQSREALRLLHVRYTNSYAEEALRIKQDVSGMILLANKVLSSGYGRKMAEGFHQIEHTRQDARDDSRQVEQLMTNKMNALKREHQKSLEALGETYRKASSDELSHHASEVKRLREIYNEAKNAAALEKNSLTKSLQEANDTIRKLQRDLDVAQAELNHRQRHNEVAAIEQTNLSVRENAIREESAKEIRSLRQKLADAQQHLNDALVEQRHTEDEVRELKSEVQVLQQLLGEKDDSVLQVRGQLKGESNQLATALAAKDSLRAQVEELQRELDNMRNLREVNEARHKRLLEDVQSNAKALEKLVTTTQNELEKALEEKRALERKLRETERKLNVLLDEKKDLEENEGGFATQLQSSKAEVSALRERCANLESLKNIAEANFQESQRRESELLAKIDELRSAQQLMQLCFDKQQEQLEIGRRMREYNPNRISSK